jgi:hypothetical protein
LIKGLVYGMEGEEAEERVELYHATRGRAAPLAIGEDHGESLASLLAARSDYADQLRIHD